MMRAFDNLKAEFGDLKLSLVAMNGLGLNPSKIITGEAQGPLSTGTKFIRDFSGQMTGKLSGYFSGTDYTNVLDSVVYVNTYGTLVTEDREQVAVRLLGESDGGDVRVDVQLRNYGRYNNWNNARILGLGKVGSDGSVTLTLHEADGDAPFKDPDISHVDYANFPYKLEDLQGNPDVWSVYSGEGQVIGAHSFGVDVMDIFGGNVKIPGEGIRLNGYFSGPAVGGVNGVILGRNFQTVTPDGASHINSKIIVRTFDGETLLVEAQGGMFPQTGASWWETNRTVSNLPRYAEAAKRYNVGVGSTDVQSGKVIYNHFSMAENPFASLTH